jgi:hypothetical protein
VGWHGVAARLEKNLTANLVVIGSKQTSGAV